MLGRWRILKLPILLQKKDQVDNVVFTCVILHNMVHCFDGRDEWESGIEWGHADGNFDEDDEDTGNWGMPRIRGKDKVTREVLEDEDHSRDVLPLVPSRSP